MQMARLLLLVALCVCACVCAAAASPVLVAHPLDPTPSAMDRLVRTLFGGAGANADPKLQGGANGGGACAGCVIALGLFGQLVEVHNSSVADELEKVCSLFPEGPVRSACDDIVKAYGPIIIDHLEAKETPDVICHAIGVCSGQCRLFPAPSEGLGAAVARVRARTALRPLAALPKICDLPGVKAICRIINNFAGNHFPLDDFDHDGFSVLPTFRGSDWRGKDCADGQAEFHPGAKPVDGDRQVDSNCNGIVGVNQATGRTWEDELCSDTPQYGIIGLGDSATAHFHVPPQYLDATQLDNSTFDNLLYTLENEFDWPMLSATTGFANASDWSPDVFGPTNSTYLVNRMRNRCTHRDYQNVGVNGARAGSMNDSIVQSMSRVQLADHPVMAFYALIGNDVCNGHPDTIAHMTTPEEMYDAAHDTMVQLDAKLPAGSVVIMTGLANGSILYEAMHDRIHPIGHLHNDVDYTAVYDFLNCLEISPCRGWMNPNATLRTLTTQRAMNLSNALAQLAQDKPSWNNFKLFYIDNPLHAALAEWSARGGQTWQLIEPVDGFHPDQLGQALITDQVWLQLGRMGLMPPVNPNNDQIDALFGDQGGYW